jgi:hemerythrin-like metal-binding protein
MVLIELSNKLNTGVDEINNHHRKLVEIINKLNDSITNKSYELEINGIFDELVEYTIYHFSSEEKFMEEVGYEDLENHKRQREKFVDRLQRFKYRSFDAIRETSIDLCSFLAGWIVAHILHNDKHIAKYVEKSGTSYRSEIFTI